MQDDPRIDRQRSTERDVTAPRKRFFIRKLEERIAPKGGKGTNNCGSGGGSSNNSGASSGWSGGYSIY